MTSMRMAAAAAVAQHSPRQQSPRQQSPRQPFSPRPTSSPRQPSPRAPSPLRQHPQLSPHADERKTRRPSLSPVLHQLDLLEDDPLNSVWRVSQPLEEELPGLRQCFPKSDRLSPLHLDGGAGTRLAPPWLDRVLDRLQLLSLQVDGVASSQARLEKALAQLQTQQRNVPATPQRQAKTPPNDPDCEGDEPILKAVRSGQVGGECALPVDRLRSCRSTHARVPDQPTKLARDLPGASSPSASPSMRSQVGSGGSPTGRSNVAGKESIPKGSTSAGVSVADTAWNRQVSGNGRFEVVNVNSEARMGKKSQNRTTPTRPIAFDAMDMDSVSVGEDWEPKNACKPSWQLPATRSIVLRQRRSMADNEGISRMNVRRATTKGTGGISYTFLPQKRCGVMHPDHKTRLLLDMVFVVMATYDAWAVPYQMAWHVHYTGWYGIWTYCTLVWWTLDMILGFFTGYYRKGRLEMNHRRIALHYVKTSFIFNFIAILSDCVVISIETHKQTAGENPLFLQFQNVARICKITRLIRMVIAVRRGRLSQFYNRLVNVMRQNGLRRQFQTVTTVLQLICVIVWVNHLGACFWRYIGGAAIQNWYSEMGRDYDKRFDYLLSFYWSISALVAGDSIMDMKEFSEVLCTCMFILFGLLFVSVLISSLAATVMDFHMSNKELADKLKMLRQYLYQQEVGAPVAIPIEMQIKKRMADVQRISESDVEVLSFLSAELRAELWHSIYAPGLKRSAFLRAMNAVDGTLIKDLCFNEGGALLQVAHDPGSTVFEPDTEAPGAYFVHWGSLEYTMSSMVAEHSTNTGSVTPRVHNLTQEVARGAWVSELALHTQWVHCGWLEAASKCELLTVTADGLIKVLNGRKELMSIAQHYGEAVIIATNREPMGQLSDVHMAVDHDSIITSMPHKSRFALSQGALQTLDKNQKWGFQPKRDLQELEEELRKGKCDIILNEEGRVLRVVSLCVIRLEREDGRVLVQIAEWDAGTFTEMGCKLPGTKVRSEELPQDALRRAIKKEFAHLQPEALRQLEESLIAQATRSVNTEEKVSQNYGINSRYLRNEFRMQIGPEFFLQDGAQSLTRSQSKFSKNSGIRRFQRGDKSVESLQVDKYEPFAKVDPEDPEHVTVQAWLDPEVLAILSSSAGEPKVRDWVYGFKDELMDLVDESYAKSAGGLQDANPGFMGRMLSQKRAANKISQNPPRSPQSPMV